MAPRITSSLNCSQCSFMYILYLSSAKNILYRSKPPPEVFLKQVFLKFSQNSQKNTCPRVSFLIKLQAYCEIFKNNFFTEHLWTTASVKTLIKIHKYCTTISILIKRVFHLSVNGCNAGFVLKPFL